MDSAICGDGMCPYNPCAKFPNCKHLDMAIGLMNQSEKNGYNKAIKEVREWFMKKAEYYGWFGFTDVIDEFDKKFGKVG